MLLARAYTQDPPTNEALSWVWWCVNLYGNDFNSWGAGECPEHNNEVVTTVIQGWGLAGRDELYALCLQQCKMQPVPEERMNNTRVYHLEVSDDVYDTHN